MNITFQIEDITDTPGGHESHVSLPIQEADLRLPFEIFIDLFVRPLVRGTLTDFLEPYE